MNRTGTCFALLALAGLLTACGGKPPPAQSAVPPAAPSPAEPAAPPPDTEGITARALLDQVMAEARKWQPDAELAGVSTSLAESPRHAFWFYDLQSRATGTCTRIRALAKGSVENVGAGDECILMQPVSATFVDSPVVWDAARAAGFEPGDSAQFGLRVQRDEALPAPRECWVLWSDADEAEAGGGIRGWCVDPATGAFVVRLSGKGRTEPLQ